MGSPTLLSVNVGGAKDVPWHGSTVHTGIWKSPVAGRRLVRRLNIDGDEQGDRAAHGGENRAVLVYQIDSYRHWRERLGFAELPYGAFGENFTVDGLSDDTVCVGDRYRIGEAEFEVTQPRVTCFRVGMRLGEPRMAALLVADHRPGFYLRVLREGHVEAGDEIVKVAGGPESMSVAEIDALLYLPGRDPDALARALRIDALSPGWQGSFRDLLAEPAPEGPAWPGFRPLKIAGTGDESPTVRSFRLAAADGAPLPAAQPGQYLTVKLGPAIRNYSLSGPPGSPEYRISVKRERHGTVSNQLYTEVGAGDELMVAAPRGTFTLSRDDRPVLLISAGVGVTPVLAMLHVLAGHREPREVWWLHGARNGREHLFAGEVRELLGGLPDAHAHICYSRPEATDRAGADYTTEGRLSAALLAELPIPRAAHAYLCGPQAFMDDVRAGLLAHGLAPNQVHTEVFGTKPRSTPGMAVAAPVAPHEPPGPPGTGPSVVFSRSGITTRWPESAPQSLLDLAEACDIPTRWGCRTGVCHSCETPVLDGDVEYLPEPLEPAPPGTALICCARPRGDLVLDL